MSKRKSSEKENEHPNNGIAIARDSIRDIRRISEEKQHNLHEVDLEKAFNLSYLRRQFTNTNALETLFNRYTERINQTYFSIFLLIQFCFNVTHFILILFINLDTGTLSSIILDLVLYSLIALLSIITLYFNEIHVKSHSTILKLISFLVLSLIFIANFLIPIYYSITSVASNLRPAYTMHVLIACYVFCNIKSNLYATLMGLSISVCHLVTLKFITYENYERIWERLVSDMIFLLCINGLAICFRYANELIKRRAFLDHRGCVESTLKLKYEKEQEEQLMSSIIPEHIIKEVRQDILSKIEYFEKTLRIPRKDKREIPYVHEYDNVTILYADIVNYTAMTSKLPVKTLVETLNDLFSGFDEASEQLNVLRIKFLGDCYYCVAGIPPNLAPNHAEACIDLGLAMISLIRSVREKRQLSVDMRIGVHSGKILSGLIGSTKWQFDIWSKDAHLANKMETTGEAGKVHITEQTRSLIKKAYNILPCNKGITDPNLIPYNITTYLISPPELLTTQQQEPTDAITQSNTPRRSIAKKKLSMIGETNPQLRTDPPEESTNKTTVNGLAINASCDLDAYDSETPSPLHFERRISYLNSVSPSSGIINRRPSGNPAALNKRISGRRLTPSEIKRRTAFMDNNIKRYQQRLQDTEQKIKEAIDEMPLSLYEQWRNVKGISPFFLIFKDRRMEWSYIKLNDPLYKYYLILYVLIFISTILIQNLTQPQWELGAWLNYSIVTVILIILIPLSWLHTVWKKYFADNSYDQPQNRIIRVLYNASSQITTNSLIRIAIYLCMFFLFLTCVLVELIICKEQKERGDDDVRLTYKRFLSVILETGPNLREHCIFPWHISHTLALTILVGFLFLRIHTWIKFILTVGVVIFYSVAVWNFDYRFYEYSETFNYMMKPQIAHILSLVYLTIILHMMDRQTDYLNRLDYQWNKMLVTEQIEVNTMHRINTMLLKNILPIHVAELYLDVSRSPSPKELYSEEYKNVAVIFASIVDYSMEVFTEMSFLKFINQIIQEFDHLLLKERLRPIEKIKVAHMTYMAACGLEPGRRDSLIEGYSQRPHYEHVAVTLVKFAVDMMKKLQQINAESFQECKLRIGICHGEVMAGVVGSKKPFYDIWGDTVNLASRMDSTGTPGRIQVTENTANVLRENSIECEFRDRISVKGKTDKVPTYFVTLTDDNNLIYSTDL